MANEACVTNIKTICSPAKEISEVNWITEVTIQNLKDDDFDIGQPFNLICPDRHCTDNVEITQGYHAFCYNLGEKGYLAPVKGKICLDVKNPTIVDQDSTKRSDSCRELGRYPLTCYCCCSCFAYGTRIGVPEGSKVIEQFVVGDKVLTANVESSGTGVKLNWSSTKVSFSSGTGPDSQEPAMVYIHHGEVGSLVVTPDHLFLLPNGKLKRADRLVPGQDQLVSAEGTPVAINEVSLGTYTGGVHHIATDKEFTGDLNGHLLISEGVVSGDFNLQIHASELKEHHFVDDHDNLPKIGSSDYERLNTHLASGNYMTFMTVDKANTPSKAIPKPRTFYVHGQHTCLIPDTAAKYLSTDQERDVNDKAPRREFSEMGIGNAVVTYALKLFQGFYPNITFYHDTGRLEPNAYAFTQYGKDIIVLSGGLTRIKGLGLEGLSLILAHLVSRLQKSPPLDDNGYTSTAMADYYIPGILQNVYFVGSPYSTTYKNGLKQITETIFNNINKQDHDQYEEDPYQPTIDTRLDALDAGYAMDFPPPGIGGPTLGGLQLTGATASPAQLTPKSFINHDITSDMAQGVYEQLQNHKVLDAQGVLNAEFNLNSDLSFLFPDLSPNPLVPEDACDDFANLRKLLTEEVRYILLHVGDSIQVQFNIDVNSKTTMDGDDYELQPTAKVMTAQISPDNPSVVLLTAKLERNVEYTLTVPNYLRAADGSTLDSESSPVKFKLA
jgi:hypothetical protein